MSYLFATGATTEIFNHEAHETARKEYQESRRFVFFRVLRGEFRLLIAALSL